MSSVKSSKSVEFVAAGVLEDFEVSVALRRVCPGAGRTDGRFISGLDFSAINGILRLNRFSEVAESFGATGHGFMGVGLEATIMATGVVLRTVATLSKKKLSIRKKIRIRYTIC